MKAVGFQKSLPITERESLLDIELPDPVPEPRDLLVEVKAVSVNPVDTKMRMRGVPEGMTKALFDKKTRRLIGAAMTGVNAGELIAEAVLALEMGADSHDIGLTIHPHPTLSETLFFAAEMAEGSITDLYVPKK